MEARLRWPEIQRRVESFYYRLITHLTIKENGDKAKLTIANTLLRRVGEESLELFGIRIKEDGTAWKFDSKYLLLAFYHSNGCRWLVDLLSGTIFNESGVREEAKAPAWLFSPTYNRLFGSRRHNYQNTGQALYFTDQHLGAMRYLAVPGKDSLDEGLQCSIEGEWCQYLSPALLAKEIPHSLLVSTHLWKSPQGWVWIFSRADNKPLGQIYSSGLIEIKRADQLEGGCVGYMSLRISRHFGFANIDRPEYIELRQCIKPPIQLAFTRYRSINRQPLVLDYTLCGWCWRHDNNFFLLERQQKHLLPALHPNNYLLLSTLDRKRRKLIVPCKQFGGATDLSRWYTLD